MAAQKRRTEIQIETHEIEIVRLASRDVMVVCEICNEPAYAFTAHQAAQILNSSVSELSRLAEEERVHAIAVTTPHLLCGASLAEMRSDESLKLLKANNE
jgi:hypothetical protein